MRVFRIGKILQRLADVSLVLMVTEAVDADCLQQTRQQFDLRAVIPVKTLPRTISSRFQHELDPKYFGMRGQTFASHDKNLFLKLSRDYDLIWFHTVRIPDAIGQFRWKRSILDVDDLASQLYDSKAKVQQSPLWRLLDRRMKYIWQRRERLFLKRFDILCVCSEIDRKLFNNPSRVYVVRNGFETVSGGGPAEIDPVAPRLGFIGGLNYSPNREGIEWFIKKVLPLIKTSLPALKLRLVGADTDGGISTLGADIDGLGRIEDVGYEISTWSAMIVPIRQGGGTRIKVAEGFARRCPVIATSVGAYGYEIENGKEALIADDPVAFSRACVAVLCEPDLRRKLTDNAFYAFSQRYTWEAQEKSIFKAVNHCLRLATHF
jgi:glycosyltransferase involved in cell wall biosynthesis